MAKEINQRGCYDDCIVLVSPGSYATFNANCDPSYFKPGIATLAPGSYLYKLGIHNINKPKSQQYEALIQAEPVLVYRDGKPNAELGFFGINIHRGAPELPSSLGCQTLAPKQWSAFIELVRHNLAMFNQKYVPYVLTNAEDVL